MGQAVRVSEASVVQMALVVEVAGRGRAPTQCVEDMAPQGTCCSGEGQAGFQRSPKLS